MLGQVFNNRYKVLGEVLSDPFFTLYEGFDTSENKQLFVQVFSEKSRQRPLEILLRFKREIELVSKISHPSLLKVYSTAEFEEKEYLFLEYFEAVPLSRYLSGAQDIDKSVQIIIQLASGLDLLHKQNILHQSIQPANILFNRQTNTVKLFNFGYHLLRDISRILEPREVIATFGYLSPESSGILRKPIDSRSDAYSLGVLFYQLLTGHLPYESNDTTELIHQHIATQPTRPSKLNNRISPVLEKIVLRLISKEPQERFQSLNSLTEDLKEYLSQRKEGRESIDFEIARTDKLGQLSFSAKFIGRGSESQILKGLLSKAAKEEGAICAISGEPGIGKSRLVDELRADLYSLKGIFSGGKCYQYEFRTPYKVFSEAIESYIDKIKRLPKSEQDSHILEIKQAIGELGAEVAKIAPSITDLIGQPPELVELEPEKEKVRFLITITNFIISLACPDSPLLLFLDDMQWMDDGSFEILERVSAKIKDSSLLLIISYRDNEVDQDHPLAQLLMMFRETGRNLFEIPIKSFDLAETTQMISQILMEKEEGMIPLAENLYQRAKGNPFFTLELLHTLVDTGVVYLKENHYLFDSYKFKNTALPTTIVDAVLKRMNVLSEEELLIISYASVIGKEIKFGLLEQLIQKQSEAILDSIEAGIKSQLLYRDITGRESLFFMHDRIREAFYQRVPEEERVPLHRKIAAVLEEQNKDNLDSVIYDLAYHFTQGKVDDKALRYLIPAAHKAKSSYANSLAIDLYLTAKEILGRQGKKGSQEYIEVLENLGEAYRLARNFPESLESLQVCESLIPQEDKLHKAQVLSKIGDTLVDNGQLDKGAKVIEEALKNLNLRLLSGKAGVTLGILKELIRQMFHMWFPNIFVSKKYRASERDLIVVRLLARLDHIYFVFDMNKTLYIFLKGLNISEKLGPCSELSFSYSIGGGVWSGFPWFSRSFRDLSMGLKMAQSLGDKIREGSAYAYTVYASYLANRPKQGIEAASKAISLLKGIGEYWDLGLAYSFVNYNYWISGNLEESRLNTQEFFEMAKEFNATEILGWAYYIRAKTLCFLGEIDEALINDLNEAIRLAQISKSGADELNSLGIMAFAYLRAKDYPHAIQRIEDLVKLLPTHYTKTVWILDVFPLGAQIYLNAVLDTPALSKEQRKQYLKRARWFLRQANLYSFTYKFFYGWALQANAAYFWLTGEKRRASLTWEKAISFLREHTQDKFRLAYCLFEQGSFLLKDNPKDKRAFENLLEAKELFAQMGCRLDLDRTNKLLGGISGETVESREMLTQKRHLDSLLSVTTVIGSVFVLEDLLAKILEYALKVTGAERGFFFLYDGKDGSLSLKFFIGLTKELSSLAFSWDNYKISLAFIKEVERTREAIIISPESSTYPKIKQELETYSTRQALGIPLITRDRSLGLIYLDNRLASGTFGKDELELMKSFAIQASVSIENAFLVKEIVEKERLAEELRLGREIQTHLLPKEVPVVPGLSIQGVMYPAKEIGGDYYDFIKLPKEDELAIAIGDVSGKGVGAGLIMATAKATLKSLSQQEDFTPKQVLCQINSLLCEYTGGDKFMTMLYLKWFPDKRSLQYSSAGHEHILIYRKQDSRVESIKSGGFVLGVYPEIDNFLENNEITLLPEDRVILYTDGVTEARNEAEELFSLQRLISIVEKYGKQSAEELLDSLKKEIFDFMGSREQYDDISIVVMGAEA